MGDEQVILKEIFGYDSFRPGQGELVDAILSGHDVLGIMPTGAGKSICYQVPALCMNGITLVVSPLISLMKDQVESLVQAGDLPNQRKPQPCAAVLSAAGFIHPEKGMENAALKFRLNAAAGIAYANENLGFRLRCYCLHRAAGAVLKPSGGNCAVLPLL